MFKKLGLSLILGALAFSHFVFAQATQERIVQSIIVNGQQAKGVFIVQNGTFQSQTCPAPQQYVDADQSSSGWACFEPSTGMWLLHAQPPLQTEAPQQGPTIMYSQPTTVYVPAPTSYPFGCPYAPYPYSYPYGYSAFNDYPYYYGYPYVFGPTFGSGFRSPFFVNRPFINRPIVSRPIISRPFIGRPVVGRPVTPFASSRSFTGGRPFGAGFRPGGMAGGRGRR